MSGQDAELIKDAVGGDRKALAGLLEQCAPQVRQRLIGRIPRHLRPVLSEDDVMQETYADAFTCISRFVPVDGGSFVGWLVTIADCNLADAIKMLEAEKRGGGRRRIPLASGEDTLTVLYELVGPTSSTPSRAAARAEVKSDLLRAIEQLPESHRRVVTMYDLEERPVEEVAGALGRSPGAVFMVRARAHRRLAEILGTISRYLSGST